MHWVAQQIFNSIVTANIACFGGSDKCTVSSGANCHVLHYCVRTSFAKCIPLTTQGPKFTAMITVNNVCGKKRSIYTK